MIDRRTTGNYRSGLTLVEVLVITAVLTLLAGLLLPVLPVARDRARGVTCTANLRQLALAFQMYMDDCDRTYPANSLDRLRTVADVDRLWIGQIRHYLRSQAVLHCPADPIRNARRTLSDALPEAWEQPGLPTLSYGANWDLLWLAAEGSPLAKVDALRYPSQTLMVADCSEPWAFGPIYQDRQGVLWSHIAYANGPPVDGSPNLYFHGGRSGRGHERHGSGSFVAFMDGHVAFLPASRFYQYAYLGRGPWADYQRPIMSPKAVPPEALHTHP